MAHRSIPPRNRRYARALRREPTDAESRLWHEIRDRRLDRIKFCRQVPIIGYIVDFVCLEAKLIVELDGGQHSESAYDAPRDAALKAIGFRVLRFWNDNVLKDINGTCDTIIDYVHDQSLQPWR